MTNTLPKQEFQIGQRVKPDNGDGPFYISAIWVAQDGKHLRYSSDDSMSHAFDNLTLLSERLPYLPSERRVIGHDKDYASQNYIDITYRCETDTELVARHAIERAEYDRLNVDDGVLP